MQGDGGAKDTTWIDKATMTKGTNYLVLHFLRYNENITTIGWILVGGVLRNSVVFPNV